MTKDEIIIEQAAVLAKLNSKYEILKSAYDGLSGMRQKEVEALDAYVEKYGAELKDEIMSVPF